MKKIGILGGLGPESTIDYYTVIIEAFNTRHIDLAYPEILIYSANINEFMKIAGEQDWKKLFKFVT